jgi:hypothetical protein
MVMLKLCYYSIQLLLQYTAADFKFQIYSRVLKLPEEDATMARKCFGDSDEAGVVEIIGGGTTICGEPK